MTDIDISSFPEFKRILLKGLINYSTWGFNAQTYLESCMAFDFIESPRKIKRCVEIRKHLLAQNTFTNTATTTSINIFTTSSSGTTPAPVTEDEERLLAVEKRVRAVIIALCEPELRLPLKATTTPSDAWLLLKKTYG